MLSRHLVSLLFLLAVVSAQAQHNHLGIANRAILESAKDSTVLTMTLNGSPALEDQLRETGLSFRSHDNGYYEVIGKSDELLQVATLQGIDWIEPMSGQPHLLNDSMISNNRVKQVHAGLSPLQMPYSGKGVVLGFIDTGLDFSHPDFQDSLGNTRILKIWDQRMATTNPNRVPSFGYGQVWDSTDINDGICPHDDDVLSHGTNVAGIATGNGLALNKYAGVAPEAHIIAVASNFSSGSWLNTVADGVEYIFNEADLLGLPCVVNISAGEYLGSHDGSDFAAVRIRNLIQAKKGRAVVAAAGNAGNLFFHLGYDVTSDTNFTWFQHNANNFIGLPGVYFQLWADTADFNQVDFAIGANRPSPSFGFRGRTSFDRITNRLNMIVTDSIVNNGNRIAIVETFATLIGDKYFLEVLLHKPDSASYLFGFTTTGSGHFDVWSDTWLGTSHMYKSPLPIPSVLPAIVHYKQPDTLQTMVSSFTCLPEVITVGNYHNRNSYVDYDTIVQTFPVVSGAKAANSSLGPNRKGLQKPDLSASGDYTLTANRLASIPLHLANNQADRIAVGGMHKRNGGTSMAAPVVAGVVALMLEMCSDLDHELIRELLIDSVYTDSFTGTNLPNSSYGYGKVNAFGTLQSLSFNPQINPVGEAFVCPGEYLQVSGPADINDFQWSHGYQIRDFKTDTTGNYVLIATDSNGCTGRSDSLFVVRVSLPAKPVIHLSGSGQLSSSPAVTYQWYLNGNALLGWKTQTITPVKSGNYSVVITDLHGCQAESNAFNIKVGIEEENALEWKVYPVPSESGLIVYEFPDLEEQSILLIFNSTGQEVYRATAGTIGRIDLATQPAGLYNLVVKTDQQVRWKKKLILHR